jgi:hypothetical protein
MSRGREPAPFPDAPSPKTNLGRLHKTLDKPRSSREPMVFYMVELVRTICKVAVGGSAQHVDRPAGLHVGSMCVASIEPQVNLWQQ